MQNLDHSIKILELANNLHEQYLKTNWLIDIVQIRKQNLTLGLKEKERVEKLRILSLKRYKNLPIIKLDWDSEDEKWQDRYKRERELMRF